MITQTILNNLRVEAKKKAYNGRHRMSHKVPHGLQGNHQNTVNTRLLGFERLCLKRTFGTS